MLLSRNGFPLRHALGKWTDVNASRAGQARVHHGGAGRPQPRRTVPAVRAAPGEFMKRLDPTDPPAIDGYPLLARLGAGRHEAGVPLPHGIGSSCPRDRRQRSGALSLDGIGRRLQPRRAPAAVAGHPVRGRSLPRGPGGVRRPAARGRRPGGGGTRRGTAGRTPGGARAPRREAVQRAARPPPPTAHWTSESPGPRTTPGARVPGVSSAPRDTWHPSRSPAGLRSSANATATCRLSGTARPTASRRTGSPTCPWTCANWARAISGHTACTGSDRRARRRVRAARCQWLLPPSANGLN